MKNEYPIIDKHILTYLALEKSAKNHEKLSVSRYSRLLSHCATLGTAVFKLRVHLFQVLNATTNTTNITCMILKFVIPH